MGPHDLLCKWCSTFVGKDKQFCSIFCESRHTRSKRRKLAYKRPVQSSGPGGHYNEFVSPRASNTAPSRKQFLEDVITAMKIEDYKAQSKGKTEDDTMSKDSQTSGSSSVATPRKSGIPRLELNKLKDKSETSAKLDKHDEDAFKPEYKLKSKTHTIYVHPKKPGKVDASQRPVISSAKIASHIPTVKAEKSKTQAEMKIVDERESKSNAPKHMETKSKTTLKNPKSENVKSRTEIDMLGSTKEDTLLKEKSKPLNSSNNPETDSKGQRQKTKSDKTDKSELAVKADQIEPLPRQQSKIATDLADRVRSSGYGAPVNLRLRPVALKPTSANMQTSKAKRESSASSAKSLSLGLAREKSRPIVSSKGQSKWELVQKPIKEEQKTKDVTMEKEKTNTTLEHEDPSPTTTSRTPSKPKENTKASTANENQSPQTPSKARSKIKDIPRRELQSIDELLREESTGSILDASVLQSRLSSIKRKVEVRRRGRDSRSSIGSDLDNTLDTSIDTTTGRDKLNTSFGNSNTPASSSRASARSNITRISKEFRSTKVN